jgi:hypothetical protein
LGRAGQLPRLVLNPQIGQPIAPLPGVRLGGRVRAPRRRRRGSEATKRGENPGRFFRFDSHARARVPAEREYRLKRIAALKPELGTATPIAACAGRTTLKRELEAALGDVWHVSVYLSPALEREYEVCEYRLTEEPFSCYSGRCLRPSILCLSSPMPHLSRVSFQIARTVVTGQPVCWGDARSQVCAAGVV